MTHTKILIALSIALFSSIGFGMDRQVGREIEEDVPHDIAVGFDIDLTYFFGTQMNGKTDRGDSITVENTGMNMIGLPGIGIKYQNIPSEGFGYTLTARHEFFRPFGRNRIVVGKDVYQYTPSDSTISTFIGEVNGTLGFDDGYMFLGANYSIPVVSDPGSIQFTGSFGGQAGVGIAGKTTFFHLISERKYTFEIFMQVIDYTASEALSGSGNAILSWPGIGFRYGVLF